MGRKELVLAIQQEIMKASYNKNACLLQNKNGVGH
jgi:hypothetical protein